MTFRRNLTPQPQPLDNRESAPQLRRAGGARREMTSRVTLHRGAEELEGWVLNVSRGGLRVIVEATVELGEELGVQIGEEPRRVARPVWIQEEPDGSIVGMAFIDVPDGAAPPKDPPPGDASAEQPDKG